MSEIAFRSLYGSSGYGVPLYLAEFFHATA